MLLTNHGLHIEIVINRSHPIAAGLDPHFVIPQTEMYGEPFLVPEPMETVFISWYDGGEVFRRSTIGVRSDDGRHDPPISRRRARHDRRLR